MSQYINTLMLELEREDDTDWKSNWNVMIRSIIRSHHFHYPLIDSQHMVTYELQFSHSLGHLCKEELSHIMAVSTFNT